MLCELNCLTLWAASVSPGACKRMHASATSHSSVSISQWHKSASTACLCHVDLCCHMIKELHILPLKPLNAADCLRTRITRVVWISCPALNETIIHVCLLKAQLKSLFCDSPQSYCLPAQAVSALCGSYVDQHFNQRAENLKSNSCRFQICVSKGILTVCCEKGSILLLLSAKTPFWKFALSSPPPRY